MSLPCLRHTIPVDGLFGLPIKPFGLLVGIGVMVGYTLGRRRAGRTGLDADICANGMVWTVVGGFVVAHLVSVIAYFPRDLIAKPYLLLMFWERLSSFGGFVGGALGAFLYFRKVRVSLLQYAEAIVFGLVPGWAFGRMGCTVVHDHPGTPTDFLLGVQCGQGGAVVHDLGLYELILTISLVGLLYAFKNVRPFHGFHLALMLFCYAPVRFLLDFLRTADAKYAGATPGQYFSIAMMAGAVALVVYGLRLRAAGEHPATTPVGSFQAESAPRRPARPSPRGKKQRKKKRSKR